MFSGDTTCRVFKYVKYDKHQRMYRDASGSIPTSNAQIELVGTELKWANKRVSRENWMSPEAHAEWGLYIC